MRTLMITAAGNQAGSTATCGAPATCSPDGVPITTVIGHGSIRGVTPGLTMRRGDLRRSTMDDGHTLAPAGVGVRGPFLEDTVDGEAMEVDTAKRHTTRRR